MIIAFQTFQSRTTNSYLLVSSKGISWANLHLINKWHNLKKGQRQNVLRTASRGTSLSKHWFNNHVWEPKYFFVPVAMSGAGKWPTRQDTEAAFTHLQTQGEQRQGHRQLSGTITNASRIVWSAMGNMVQGDLAYHRGSRKTFLEKVTPSRSETGEVGGGRNVLGSARAKVWRPVQTLSTQSLAGIQNGCVSSDRW